MDNIRLNDVEAIRVMRAGGNLRVRGVTIMFVSHSTGDVKAIADRVMWLDRGHMMDIGDPEPVISKYLAAMVEKDSAYLTLKQPSERPQRQSMQAPEVVLWDLSGGREMLTLQATGIDLTGSNVLEHSGFGFGDSPVGERQRSSHNLRSGIRIAGSQ